MMLNPRYKFLVSIDRAHDAVNYTCESCGADEHGGGVGNPALFARMKQHLRESHALGSNDALKTYGIIDENEKLLAVWFASE